MAIAQETKRRAINRLQTVYALRALVDEKYRTTLEAKREGRPVT